MATMAPVSDASIVFLPVGRVYNSKIRKAVNVIVPILLHTVLIFGKKGNYYDNNVITLYKELYL